MLINITLLITVILSHGACLEHSWTCMLGLALLTVDASSQCLYVGPKW